MPQELATDLPVRCQEFTLFIIHYQKILMVFSCLALNIVAQTQNDNYVGILRKNPSCFVLDKQMDISLQVVQ